MHPFSPDNRRTLMTCGLLALLGATSAHAERLKVTIDNLSAEEGTYLTPTWVGLMATSALSPRSAISSRTVS